MKSQFGFRPSQYPRNIFVAGFIFFVLIFFVILITLAKSRFANGDISGKVELRGDRKRIAIFFGTRPELIKLAPLVRVLRDPKDVYLGKFQTIFIHTGQHIELVEQNLKFFDIDVDISMNLMIPNQSLSWGLAESIKHSSLILQELQPDLVVVQGDTATALGAATSAYYLNVPIAHVEAGLRTWNYYHPFPEEMNRKIIDMYSSILFAPTKTAKNNLLDEEFCHQNIEVVGNTAIDSLKMALQKKERVVTHHQLILVTIHRRENIGEPLLNVIAAIKELVEKNDDVRIIWSLHPNPNFHDIVKSQLSNTKHVSLQDSVEYGDFVEFLQNCDIILTDSGGIQEEATFIGRPVLLLRTNTERSEGKRLGNIHVIGTSKKSVFDSVMRWIKSPPRVQGHHVYGSGKSANKIAEILKSRMIDKPVPLKLCTRAKRN